MASFTTDTLINSVKVRASIPSAQVTFTDADFIQFANEEISLELVPLILKARQEFYVTTSDIQLVAETTRYSIPYRSIGTKIRTLFHADANGNLTKLTRIEPELREEFGNSDNVSNDPFAFYMEGNDIVLCNPINDVNGSLRVSFYMRPNELVEENRVGIITAINTATGTLTISGSVPSNITVGSYIDLVEARPGHKLKDYDLLVTAVNTATRTVSVGANNLPTNLIVGDHCCTAGETKIPQIPADLHVVLAQTVACRVLESIGDEAGLKSAERKLDRMVANTLTIISDRTEGNPKKILNTNSPLWRNRRAYRRVGGY